MKKNIKAIYLLSVILLSIMIPFSLSTSSYEENDTIDENEIYNETYKDNNSIYDDFNSNYKIKKYNTDLVVNEDNTLNITENITAYFNKSKHGIILKIPEENEVFRLDNSITKKKLK